MNDDEPLKSLIGLVTTFIESEAEADRVLREMPDSGP
jgi:hypothetical protein